MSRTGLGRAEKEGEGKGESVGEGEDAGEGEAGTCPVSGWCATAVSSTKMGCDGSGVPCLLK